MIRYFKSHNVTHGINKFVKSLIKCPYSIQVRISNVHLHLCYQIIDMQS
jgi:hypothetical protein